MARVLIADTRINFMAIEDGCARCFEVAVPPYTGPTRGVARAAKPDVLLLT